MMRRGNLFWALVLILIGAMLLADQLLPGVQLGKFIPAALLIFVGGWLLLVSGFSGRRNLEEKHISIPLEGAQEAEVNLGHGAGSLVVSALESQDELLSGTFGGSPIQKLTRQGEVVRVRLKVQTEDILPGINQVGLDWDLGLNCEIPLKLKVNGGASEINLDLADLKVTDLELNTGASSTRIDLPAEAGFTRVEINAGAASVEVIVPEGVAARIRTSTGLSSVSIDAERFPRSGKFHESPDYSNAENKVEITVEIGVGSFEIR